MTGWPCTTPRPAHGTLAAIVYLALGALTLVSMNPATAATPAQATRDVPWTPWLGCWALVDSSDPEMPVTVDGVLVCISRSEEDHGVLLHTRVGRTERLTQTIVADGIARPLETDRCRGTQRSEWSRRSGRLFSHVQVDCDDEGPRTVSGLSFIAPSGEWIDVQAVRAGDRESVRVRRYRRAPDSSPDAQTQGVPASGAPWSIDEVLEAGAAVSARAIEAALVESRASFPLNRRELVRLEEGGVDAPTIDLMIALSFPERFEVARSGDGSVAALAVRDALGPVVWLQAAGLDFADPYYWYLCSPFGFSYWATYDPYYHVAAGFVVIQPGPPAGEHGRVVKGLGYMQVQVRDHGASATDAKPGSPAGSAGATAPSSGGFVSSEGYSSGAGGSGGRTAQPRPPGSD